jgi:hypothetical protein
MVCPICFDARKLVMAFLAAPRLRDPDGVGFGGRCVDDEQLTAADILHGSGCFQELLNQAIPLSWVSSRPLELRARR